MRQARVFIGAVAGAAAVSLLGVTGAAASPLSPARAAQAAGAHPDTATFALCSNKGSAPSSCLSVDPLGPTGTEVIAYEANRSGAYQAIAEQSTTACGNGRVSQANNCPFTVNSGLNSHLNGDAIITFKFVNLTSNCVGTEPLELGGTGTEVTDCSNGLGRWWVQDGTFAFANVAESNYLFSHGANYPNDEAYLSDPTQGGHFGFGKQVQAQNGFIEHWDQWNLTKLSP